MFKIIKYDDEMGSYVEILNADKSSYSKIYLNKGASLQELILANHHIIKNLSPLTYEDTYASSILFPFANRVKDGKYKFQNKCYQLEVNEKDLNNALHGLVYNKTFEIVNQKVADAYATIKLEYHETEKSNGFPFSYSICLDYTLMEFDLEMNLCVKNTDSNSFPFTLGWHPYFSSDDLSKSSLRFDSHRKFECDHRNITTGIIETEIPKSFKINNQDLNDCFLLNSGEVYFQTTQYILRLSASESDSFLQLYTPSKKNIIAIELTTGVSDSFNNGIGLKTLKPKESYCIHSSLAIQPR